jgi:lipopolysaccharide transport system ATP-binding protein
MKNSAIRVENLAQCYRIDLKRRMHNPLADALGSWIRSPLANFQRLRKLGKVQEGEESEDLIWALKDVSFDVEDGEIIGIIGANGAGKSTLLKILSHITEPTSGKAVVRGRVSSLLEVGTGFHSELTGRENIYLNGTILGMTKKEVDRKFDEIVAFSEVEKFIDTPIKRYSSGMQVRLAFSVAAHLEPEILLMDEVLAVGDAGFQKKCLGKMGEVAKGGRTVLFVSHNMGAVNSLCSRSILLNWGRVSRIGPTSEVIGEYLSDHSLATSEGHRGFALNLRLLEYKKKEELIVTHMDIVNPASSDGRAAVGEPLDIRICYSAQKRFQYPTILLSIFNLRGDKIIDLDNFPVSRHEIEELFPSGEITLHIDELPLVPGRYVLHLEFTRGGQIILQKYRGIAEFEVSFRDVYGSGYAPKEMVMVKHRWDHRQTRDHAEGSVRSDGEA